MCGDVWPHHDSHSTSQSPFQCPLHSTPLHSSAGFRSQGLRQMMAMTAAPKKKNASGQGTGGRVLCVLSIRRERASERASRCGRVKEWNATIRQSTSTPTSTLLHTRCTMTSHEHRLQRSARSILVRCKKLQLRPHSAT